MNINIILSLLGCNDDGLLCCISFQYHNHGYSFEHRVPYET